MPSAVAPALLRLVHARGGDAGLLAIRFDLDVDLEGGREGIREGEMDDAAMLSPSALNDLVEAAAEMLGEPFFALALPTDLPLRRYMPGELAARASNTVREALARLAKYTPLLHPQIACTLEERGEEAIWTQSTPGHARGVGRCVHEYGLAYALVHGSPEPGVALSARRVWFTHARPREISALVRFFGTIDVAFGRENSGFVLDRTVLDQPMHARDPRLVATADDLANDALRAQGVEPREARFVDLVEARLRTTAGDDIPDIDRVARSLHMSARTLQRRLGDEGAQFSDMVDRVREETARRLLRDPALALTEIGERLGFADLATFSRAFKRWTGQPPGTWRRQT